jgi:uncharacterized membrane protein YfcA
MPTWADLVVLLAGVLAGGLNALAGGGTLLSFPLLVLTGLPATIANATNAVALVPGALASVVALREPLRERGRLALLLLGPSLVGGGIGALVLLRTPDQTFTRWVPALILGAAALVALHEPVARWQARRGGASGTGSGAGASTGEATRYGAGLLVAILLGQLVVATYGGYFGAGMGIAMVGLLGLLPGVSLHAAQALKALLGAAINATAATIFLFRGAVHPRSAIIMAVGAIAGGYLLGRTALRLHARALRVIVIAISAAVAGFFLWRQLH